MGVRSGDGSWYSQGRGVLLIWIIVSQGPTVLPDAGVFLSLSFIIFLFFCLLSWRLPAID